MGTRNLQTVISKEGEMKVHQYCQWDGYPSGQGIDILRFLKTANIEKYTENVSKLRWITDKEGEIIDTISEWYLLCPQLSRDFGSRIHKAIEIEAVKVVQNTKDAEIWCEGFYTIDLKKMEFKTEWRGKIVTFTIGNLPTEQEYLKSFEDEHTN